MIISDPIDQCQEYLAHSLLNLRSDVSREQTQGIAKLIIESMSGNWRSFHTPIHVFELAKNGDDIEVLAALFHDTVYVQVDQGIADPIFQYISPYIYEDSQQIYILHESKLLEDPCFRLCMMTFGFQLGQALPVMGGQNEFLSALLATKLLRDILPLQVLAQVVACIEATIPFRSRDQDGLTCSDQLFMRLEKINTLFDFSWSDQEIRSIVKRSVRLSNRDVDNFSSEDPAAFLEITWSLIPESNHELNNFEIYSTKHYVLALERMEGFMSSLSQELIFKDYDHYPSQAQLNVMLMRAKKNLEIARLYLGVKLVPLALKVAYSLPDSSVLKNIDSHLPKQAISDFPVDSIEGVVMDLLKRKSGFDSEYDPSNSQLARYLMAVSDSALLGVLISKTKSFLAGDISATDYMNALPDDIKRTMSEIFALLS